jgi:hypothetical protein
MKRVPIQTAEAPSIRAAATELPLKRYSLYVFPDCQYQAVLVTNGWYRVVPCVFVRTLTSVDNGGNLAHQEGAGVVQSIIVDVIGQVLHIVLDVGDAAVLLKQGNKMVSKL